MKIRSKDIFMEDVEFHKDLEVERKTKEAEMFEMIMDSVCGGGGKRLTKEQRERTTSKFKEDCKIFKQYMQDLKVKPLRRKTK